MLAFTTDGGLEVVAGLQGMASAPLNEDPVFEEPARILLYRTVHRT